MLRIYELNILFRKHDLTALVLEAAPGLVSDVLVTYPSGWLYTSPELEMRGIFKGKKLQATDIHLKQKSALAVLKKLIIATRGTLLALTYEDTPLFIAKGKELPVDHQQFKKGINKIKHAKDDDDDSGP